MDSSLHEVWQAAAGSPFLPAIGKGTQFFVGFVLLLLGLAITAFFALSKRPSRIHCPPAAMLTMAPDRSLLNVPLLGVPASLAIAFVLPTLFQHGPSQLIATLDTERSTCSVRSESTFEIPIPLRIDTGADGTCTIESEQRRRRKAIARLIFFDISAISQHPQVLLFLDF